MRHARELDRRYHTAAALRNQNHITLTANPADLATPVTHAHVQCDYLSLSRLIRWICLFRLIRQ